MTVEINRTKELCPMCRNNYLFECGTFRFCRTCNYEKQQFKGEKK